jgi:hypothetical protein
MLDICLSCGYRQHHFTRRFEQLYGLANPHPEFDAAV